MALTDNHRHGGGSGDGNKIKTDSVDGLKKFVEDNANPASFNDFVYSGSAPSSTGNQSITGIGFQPKVAIVFATTDKGNSWGFGADGSSFDRSIYNEYDSWVSNDSTNLINAQSSSGTYSATINSYDSDGITLNWNAVGTGGADYTILFLK